MQRPEGRGQGTGSASEEVWPEQREQRKADLEKMKRAKGAGPWSLVEAWEDLD